MRIIAVTSREDLEKCFAIRMKVFVEEQQVPPELELDEFDESPQACSHILLLDGDEPVATGRWREYGEKPGTAKLQRIAVMKDHRKGGWGSLIIRALEESARQAGMTQAALDGQCQAEGFYQKLGYRTLPGEPFLDAGILHVHMEKDLA